MPRFIFIGGASASGKSTFAALLKRHIQSLDGNPTCEVVSTDNYWRGKPASVGDDKASIDEWLSKTNLDVPVHQDFPLLVDHIAAWSTNQTVEIPLFNFQTSKREVASQRVPASDFIIIEGIFALTLLNRYVLSRDDLAIDYFPVFVTNDSWRTTVDLRVKRNLSFGFSEANTRSWESKSVGPGYLKYSAVQTPGLIYVSNPSVTAPTFIEEDLGLEKLNELYAINDDEPEYQALHRYRITKRKTLEGDFSQVIQDNFQREIVSQFSVEALSHPLNSSNYRGQVGKTWKREIIADSYAQADPSQPRLTRNSFPLSLFQSFGSVDRNDEEELLPTLRQE